ncbi:hypothetical protein [Hymenobacter algoricola]|uniref:Prolyl-tRNA synthetase n=1 Tax=Hymenobacter algoricola TaxID=486267 RepID=A0ABP7N2D7_9BACT
MKKTLTAFLPALALLALGSCAGTSQLTSTEDDGVYYSSKDRTTQNATASVAPYTQSDAPSQQGTDAGTGTDEAVNPEYRSGRSGSSSGSPASTEYYDDDYGYASRIRRFNQPVYRGFGYGYYDVVYADPFWYGGGYSPYSSWGPGYYGAYYDPFYSPYTYGGTYVSINIGFGRPYYDPWRYGYGGYGYRGFGGYGGYGGYYDGYRNGGYGGYGNNYNRTKTYNGPRRDGAREAVSSTAGQSTTGRSRGRMAEGGVANPTGGLTNGSNGSTNNGRAVVPGRGRIVENNRGGVSQEMPIRQQIGNQNNGVLNEQQLKDREAKLGQASGAAEQPRLDTNGSRGRWRVVDNGSSSGSATDVSPATPQDYTQPRRSRYREMQPEQSGSSDQQPQQQRRPARQRIVSSDAGQSGQTSEQPVRQQRSSAEPSRTYSQPSNSGGNNSGGGNSGGGGARGRGRMQ